MVEWIFPCLIALVTWKRFIFEEPQNGMNIQLSLTIWANCLKSRWWNKPILRRLTRAGQCPMALQAACEHLLEWRKTFGSHCGVQVSWCPSVASGVREVPDPRMGFRWLSPIKTFYNWPVKPERLPGQNLQEYSSSNAVHPSWLWNFQKKIPIETCAFRASLHLHAED